MYGWTVYTAVHRYIHAHHEEYWWCTHGTWLYIMYIHVVGTSGGHPPLIMRQNIKHLFQMSPDDEKVIFERFAARRSRIRDALRCTLTFSKKIIFFFLTRENLGSHRVMRVQYIPGDAVMTLKKCFFKVFFQLYPTFTPCFTIYYRVRVRRLYVGVWEFYWRNASELFLASNSHFQSSKIGKKGLRRLLRSGACGGLTILKKLVFYSDQGGVTSRGACVHVHGLCVVRIWLWCTYLYIIHCMMYGAIFLVKCA